MKKIFTILGLTAIATMNAQIVISEVYGGGGAATSLFVNDYVELKNIGSSVQTLSTATLQYASATGTFNSYIALPNITLNPGQKYLVEMIASTPNTSGAPLPSADFQATSNTSFANGSTYNGGFNMAAANGKIALTSSVTQAVNPTDSAVLDFVGYGTANLYEGSGAAPALDVNNSATRNGGDTNNNAADFVKVTPTPENSTLAVSDVNAFDKQVKMNTIVGNELKLILPGKATVNIYTVDGRLVSSNRVDNGGTVNTSSLSKGNYVVTVDNGSAKVSRKVVKN